MNKKRFKREYEILEQVFSFLQQQSRPSSNTIESDLVESSGETGTIEKKRQESNRFSRERAQNADCREMKREWLIMQQQKEIKSLFKKTEDLERQVKSLQTQFVKCIDVRSKLKRKIKEKEDYIYKLEKKVKKQGNAIKQIEDIFLSIAISKKVIDPGTSFKNMVKVCSDKKKKDMSFLIKNN